MLHFHGGGYVFGSAHSSTEYAGRLADTEGPGHIAVVARARAAREQVAEDRGTRAERARADVVRIGCVCTAGDDRKLALEPVRQAQGPELVVGRQPYSFEMSSACQQSDAHPTA